LRWLLLIEEFGVTCEYLPGEKNVTAVADALSCLHIDSLKIHEEAEEALTLLSGSGKNSISNIKLTIPIHAALLFKGQKINNQGIKRKDLSTISLLNIPY
jgi:ABC-type iron transport system FetAB ATPase subunit